MAEKADIEWESAELETSEGSMPSEIFKYEDVNFVKARAL